jgi:NADH dehydrogenase
MMRLGGFAGSSDHVSANGASASKRRVVIVGGGFGGLEAARRLKHADVDVTVVDRHNHLLFQPLIYQVAAGALSSGEVAAPIRHMLKRQPNAAVLMATVTDIDVERRRLTLEKGDGLDYDSLIVACGGETSYFGHDEWREVTCGLKTLADAVDLRDRIFGAFEEAERTSDPAERDEWLRFVVVGGGPTGVEISGQLAILARHTMKRDFRRIDPRTAEVVLLDAGERVVAAFSEPTSAKAAEQLAELGVTVRERAMVTDIDARGVTVKVGEETERIATRTVVWAAGVRTAPIAEVVGRAAGAATDRAGHVEVNPDLTLPGHPEISVIGDAAKLAGPDGKPLPGLATVAIQQARHVAEGIRSGGAGASTPFKYFDKGALAVVGRGKAVCEVRGHRLSGLIAFLMYVGVHLFYLGGIGGRRLTAGIDAIASLFGSRQSRVMEGGLESVERPESQSSTTGTAEPTPTPTASEA